MADTVPAGLNHGGLVGPFLTSRFRSRYTDIPPNSARRTELLNKLAHRYSEVLDWRYAGSVSPLPPAALVSELRGLGAAAQCYCLCVPPEWDGREVPLAEALAALSGTGWPALLVCRPAVLAYFEPESEAAANQRFVLRRPAA